jgi:hypothetical protein
MVGNHFEHPKRTPRGVARRVKYKDIFHKESRELLKFLTAQKAYFMGANCVVATNVLSDPM